MPSRNQAIHALIAAVAVFVFVTAQPALVHASSWRKISPTASPSPRFYPAMAYDLVNQKIVLFGGGGNYGNFNDTWTFDGTTWTEIATSVAPPARNGASMAYDRKTKKLVMFGGFNVNQYLNDTWIWDGATSTWTEATMSQIPPQATGAMLFTDPLTGSAMMFGGYNSFQIVPSDSNTYRWTGTSWRLLHPSTVPIPRGWGIAVQDPLHRNVVVTGGNGDTIRTDNTWTWDGNNWTQLAPATQIPGYVGAAGAFDPALQSVVVLGAVADTWSWTGTDWVLLAPTDLPPTLTAIGMAYDPATYETLLFGGQGPSGNLSGETWQLVKQ